MSFPLETGARGCSDCLGASGFEFLLTAILLIAHVDCLSRVACHDFRADCCLLNVWLLCRSISCIVTVLANVGTKTITTTTTILPTHLAPVSPGSWTIF